MRQQAESATQSFRVHAFEIRTQLYFPIFEIAKQRISQFSLLFCVYPILRATKWSLQAIFESNKKVFSIQIGNVSQKRTKLGFIHITRCAPKPKQEGNQNTRFIPFLIASVDLFVSS